MTALLLPRRVRLVFLVLIVGAALARLSPAAQNLLIDPDFDGPENPWSGGVFGYDVFGSGGGLPPPDIGIVEYHDLGGHSICQCVDATGLGMGTPLAIGGYCWSQCENSYELGLGWYSSIDCSGSPIPAGSSSAYCVGETDYQEWHKTAAFVPYAAEKPEAANSFKFCLSTTGNAVPSPGEYACSWFWDTVFAVPNLLFADGFEANGTTYWSSVTNP